jgi:hypothetical protein
LVRHALFLEITVAGNGFCRLLDPAFGILALFDAPSLVLIDCSSARPVVPVSWSCRKILSLTRVRQGA